MKSVFTIVLTFLCLTVFGQHKINKKTARIVAEGKLLYQSEVASWHGTDLFLEAYTDRSNVGGYFSYTQGDSSKCIFFSRTEEPKVIGTITLGPAFDVGAARVDLSERKFTEKENDLYLLRKNALNEINTDSLFKFYKNTSMNVIPLIRGKERKVYVLTAPRQSGVVIFGNDYVLTFDRKNRVKRKKAIHKNIIPIEYGSEDKDMQVEGSMHSHLPETGEFITATDICTLMLYEKFTKWKTHNVISEKYFNIWDCEEDQLAVITRETAEKISKHQEKLKKNND